MGLWSESLWSCESWCTTGESTSAKVLIGKAERLNALLLFFDYENDYDTIRYDYFVCFLVLKQSSNKRELAVAASWWNQITPLKRRLFEFVILWLHDSSCVTYRLLFAICVGRHRKQSPTVSIMLLFVLFWVAGWNLCAAQNPILSTKQRCACQCFY